MGMCKLLLILFLPVFAQAQTPLNLLTRKYVSPGGSPVVVAQWNFSNTTKTVSGWVNVIGNPDASIVTSSDNRSGATINLSTVDATDVAYWIGNGGVASVNIASAGTGHVLPIGLYEAYFQNQSLYTAPKANIEITGLDNSKTYKIEILSSRQGSGDSRTSRFYTVDNSGTVNSTVVSGNYNGDFNYVVTGRVPVSGKISIHVGQASGFLYGYMNALKVTQE